MKLTRCCTQLIEIAALALCSFVAYTGQASSSSPVVRDNSLSQDVADIADLGPAAVTIDAIFRPLSTDFDRVWIGINPHTAPNGAQLAVYVVDSERAISMGCHLISLACQIAAATQGACAAIDPRVIACDIRFLFAVIGLAIHAADESKIHDDGNESAKRVDRFKKFLSDNRRADATGPTSRGRLIGLRLNRSTDAYREHFDSYLTAAMSIALVHEYGHIQLEHLHPHQIGLAHADDSALEFAADAFALDWIARTQAPLVLVQAPAVLADLQDYWLDTAASTAGVADFTLFQASADSTGEDEASLKAALIKVGLCDSTHPAVNARVRAMINSPSFRSVLSQWSAGYAEHVSESTRWIEPYCQRDEAIKRIELGGEVIRSVEVKLLNPGSSPRSKLRYRWARGTEQELIFSSKTLATAWVDDSRRRSNDTRVAAKTLIRVIRVDGENFKVGLQPAIMASTLVTVLVGFDNRGIGSSRQIFTKESGNEHWSLDMGIASQFADLSDLHAHTIILPDEAIGAGGSWSIRSDQQVGYSETKWTLLRREGDRLTLSGTMMTTSRASKEGKEGDGPVTAVVDLRRPAPIEYKSSLHTTTSFVSASGTLHETVSEGIEFFDDTGTDISTYLKFIEPDVP